jgi:hypothetical protein
MSTVAITVDSVDYTNSCLFAKCTFQQSMAAVPGTFQVTVRDPDRSLTFVTGVEISLDIDGVRMFGGYVKQVSMGHMAPAADTSNLSDYNLRTWTLRGTDYNTIFDWRVARNTADYLSYITINENFDGAILRSLVNNYADMTDFTTTGIEDIASIPDGDVIQQGIKLRERFENLSYFGGAVWYVDGNKNLIYKPYEDVEKRWGFSDVPNHNAITVSPTTFQGATTGFRQVEATEDSTGIVNDALIWGGSEFAGSGGTVFSREQDATSQSTYGRWQYAETHFGETNYKTQFGVDARANVIVNGPPGTDIYGEQKGLRYPQWQFDFTWFSDDVPRLSGTPDHLVAGDIVTIDMDVFGVTKLLPLRSLNISFPDALEESGDPDDHLVQFQGSFGLQMGDPFTLWRYIQKAEIRATSTVNTVLATAVTETSTTTTFGASFRGVPTPTPDGVTTVFTIAFGYVAGTTQVFLDGLLQREGTDYNETDPAAGEITMTTAPLATDNLIVTCITLES